MSGFDIQGTGFLYTLNTIIINKVPDVARDIASKKHEKHRVISELSYIIIEQKGNTYLVQASQREINDPSMASSAADALYGDRYKIGFKELRLEYFKALMRIFFKTTWIAEYLMPVLLALTGFFFYICTDVTLIDWQ